MKKLSILSLLSFATMAGCGWNHLPQGAGSMLGETWDARSPVATTDGLYVQLTHAGKLALVRPDSSYQLVDTGEGYVSRISLAPDEQTVLAFVDRYQCDEEDPRKLKKMKTLYDCPNEKLVTDTELATITNGTVQNFIDIPQLFNAISYSKDGRWAIAHIDLDTEDGFTTNGVVDLTSVSVMDLESGTSTSVSVGFAADRVLFSQDASRAVILSKNSVAVLDLTTETPPKEVTFPLTLDADQTVEPVGVELTPDGRYALISVQGSGDLYVLDLEQHSVNMVTLSANPAAMAVVTDEDPYDEIYDDRTVVVYNSGNVVDVLEHQYFDVESIALDEPMSGILSGEDSALLYTTQGGHDAYRLDLTTNEVLEYRLENPAVSMHLAPDDSFAIALTRAENGMGTGIGGIYDKNPGMEILDLTGDKAKSRAYLLEGQGVGLAFSMTETDLHAMVLQDGIEYLYQLNLYTGNESEIELSAPPVHIGALPNGEFYITHQAELGLITFLNPQTGAITESSGFAAMGLLEPILLNKEEEGQ